MAIVPQAQSIAEGSSDVKLWRRFGGPSLRRHREVTGTSESAGHLGEMFRRGVSTLDK